MVSVIIITFKRAQFITRAINSVLNQTYQDFELIIVDDNNPNTIYRKQLEDIMKQYKDNDKIKYIQHECNKNGSAARNTGIKEARGEYIAFLDDDDYYMPDRLEILVNSLSKNKEYNAAYSSVIVTKNKKIIGLTEANKSGNMGKELLLNSFAIGTGSNLFLRTNTVRDLNGFDVTFKRHQDIEFMIRFFRSNKLLAISNPLVVKVQDDRKNEPNVKDYLEIKKHFINTFKEDIENLDREDIEKFYKSICRQILEVLLRSKKYAYFFKFKNKYRKYCNFNIRILIRDLMLFINNYFRLENIKYKKMNKIVNKNFSNEVNFINKIEMV